MTHTTMSTSDGDQHRLPAFLRQHKNKPGMRDKCFRYMRLVRAYGDAREHYSRTGNLSALRAVLPTLAEARRDILLTGGADPAKTDVLPPVPVILFNA